MQFDYLGFQEIKHDARALKFTNNFVLAAQLLLLAGESTNSYWQNETFFSLFDDSLFLFIQQQVGFSYESPLL